MRRRLASMLLLLGLGACADPAQDHLGGFGDPVRGAALHAPTMLADTSRFAGQPDRAALAAVQLEILADAFENNPLYAPDATGATRHAMQQGRAEMREAIGIAPDAAPEDVIGRLREAAEAIRAGQRMRAEAALSGPPFPAGGEATLIRLSRLPRLPRVAEAGAAAGQEISRRDARSTRRS